MSQSLLKNIAETIICDIDDFCVDWFKEEPRTHLGGSVIGRKCSRQLWYNFRHAIPADIKASSSKSVGQIYRIFNRGQREEEFFLKVLQGVGCRFVNPIGPNGPTQARISDVNGHFGGSIDAIGYLPAKFEFNDKIGFEFKTANTSEFSKVKSQGVKLYKPEHHSQMCVYGYKAGLPYFLYCVVDKNTDEYHIELVEVDIELGQEMIEKAKLIVNSEIPLQRIAMTSTNWQCKTCVYSGLCFNQEKATINCRTCIHSQPGPNATWQCKLAGGMEIPKDVQKVGCQQYNPIDMNC